MYTEEHITSAIEAGIFTDKTAEAFRLHAQQMQATSTIDEEHFRLVTGFNDIFVVIACLLSLTSIAWIGSSLSPWVGPLAAAIGAWWLAEFFVSKRHMALPAIVLLLAFVGAIFNMLYTGLNQNSAGVIVAAGVASFAAWLHWLRFRVPITVAVGVIAMLGFVVTFLFKIVPGASQFISLISLLAGAVVFSIAMRWDMADKERLTRKSDVAFWLHLLAAPLLVHPVFSVLSASGRTSLIQAVIVIGLYGLIALVSLAIDRRALMVSALGYVLYIFSALLKMYGVVSLGFAITAFLIGTALLLLSAFWHPCRTLILQKLPLKIQEKLPPIR